MWHHISKKKHHHYNHVDLQTSLTPSFPWCVTIHMRSPYTKTFCGRFYQLWSQGSTNICLKLSPLLIIRWSQTVNCNWLNSSLVQTWNALPVGWNGELLKNWNVELCYFLFVAYAFAELIDNALAATVDNLGPRNIEMRLVSYLLLL